MDAPMDITIYEYVDKWFYECQNIWICDYKNKNMNMNMSVRENLNDQINEQLNLWI